MEIVLIRHGQPKWVDGDQYDLNPGLTDLGKIQAEKSASFFSENSFDKLWVSPLKRAQETMQPFKTKGVAKEIITFEWLEEALDDEEKELFGKSGGDIEKFFQQRNSMSFEQWYESTHGEYMKGFSSNIFSNLDKNLNSIGIKKIKNEFDSLFELDTRKIQRLLIISHAGTMSTLLSYFLDIDLFPWTWRKYLPRHAGHTTLKSTEISSGHFFRLKEFNNVSFLNSEEEKTY